MTTDFLALAERAAGGNTLLAQSNRSSFSTIGVYFSVGRMTVSRAVEEHEISNNKPNVRRET
jgi:hypothetical protein